jgi:1-acyl-sn-glycerol-3-phosphate acyltransferase
MECAMSECLQNASFSFESFILTLAHFLNLSLGITLSNQISVTRMNILATVTVLLSKLFVIFFTNTHVHNRLPLITLATSRNPLLTISNHTTGIDDPLIWAATFTTRELLTFANCDRLRWVSGAKEIMFHHPILSWYFTSTRVIPTIRGHGVMQEGVNKAIDILKRRNGWMHVFPEGRVNKNSYRVYTRLKWGIGRMLAEARPTLLPLRHFDLEQLDTDCGYRTFRPSVDIVIGTPVDTALDAHFISEPQVWSRYAERAQEMLNGIKKVQ